MCIVSTFQIKVDFVLMFPASVGDALLTQWPAIELEPYRKFNIRIDENMYPFEDEHMVNFFMWFQLFLPKRAKKDTALDSFIVYSSVSFVLAATYRRFLN